MSISQSVHIDGRRNTALGRWLVLPFSLCILHACGGETVEPSTQESGSEQGTASVSEPAKGSNVSSTPMGAPSRIVSDRHDGILLTQPDDKTLYTLGHSLMLDLAPYQLTAREIRVVQKGMRDSMKGELEVNPAEFMPKIQMLGQARVDARAEREKQAGETYLASMKAKPGAQISPSGMVYFIEKPGRGPQATPNQNVELHARGTLIDGTVIEDTRRDGQTIKLPLSKGMPCWIDGVTQLAVGGQAKLVCPPSLAFGTAGSAPYVPPQATVIYELELISVFAGDGVP